MAEALHTGIDYLQGLPLDELNDMAEALQDYAEEVAAKIGQK